MFSPARRELTRAGQGASYVNDAGYKTAELPVASPTEFRLGKRKRDTGTNEIDPVERHLLSFRSCEVGSTVSFIFRPCAVITRSHLPLSFLDPLSSVTMPRFLTSHVSQLVPTENICGTTVSQVLLAQSFPNMNQHRLFAIESVEQNIYTICALVVGVTLQDFARTASPHRKLSQRNASNSVHKDRWWIPAMVALDPVVDENVDSTVPKVQQESVLNCDAIDDTALGQEITTTVDVEEIWNKFIEQYLDMLYLSKTPLSYFVKGPLGRIRNVYTQQKLVSNLLDKLKNMVLPFTLFDRKYKREIRRIIEAVVVGEVANSESPNPRKRSNTSARKRTAKMGKQGLYKTEDSIIEQYWEVCLSQKMADLSDVELEKHIQHVQTREEMMQLIILLEILALTEASAKSDRSAAPENAADNNSTKARAKKSTALDLNSHLSTMIDRLCIRQAVFVEVGETKRNGLGLEPIAIEGPAASSDYLKEFFSEVIIPFYSARLRCVIKDFGARVGYAATPPKHAQSGPPGKSRDSRRRVNVEVNTSIRSNRILSRSATDGLLQAVRGDSRSPAPERRNSTDTRRTLSRSSSVGQAGALSGREIDLGAMKRFNEAKLKPKPDMKEELRHAITALKKPNREISAREYADAVSQRASLAAVAAKKLNHAGMRPIQVQATPVKAKRTFGAIAALVPEFDEDDEDMALRSVVDSSAVPSSAHRPMVHARQDTSMSGQMLPPARRGSTIAVGDTPHVVRSTNHFGFAALAANRGSDAKSPSAGRRPRAAVTHAHGDEQWNVEQVSLAAIRKRLDFSGRTDGDSTVPVVASAAEESSAAARPAGGVEKSCIYKSLGWDEEYGDELA